MSLRVFAFFGVVLMSLVLMASDAGATQCRTIVSSTFIETVHPNGAVSVAPLAEGATFIVIGCAPEGTRVWCSIQETERTAFTVRRFLEADRAGWGHSRRVDFAACLAPAD
jgi:hypothetical protein